MIDESTNISIQKKLSICVRYVVNGESQTEFLANIKIDNGYAHTIVRHLVAKLESLNIDKSKMVSLATDGTAAMLGLSYWWYSCHVWSLATDGTAAMFGP